MPISPDDVGAVKTKNIPEWVFDVWDKLIAAAWDGRSSTIRQDTAKAALHAANPGDPPVSIFDTGWLDIEPSYRAVGWSVVYDKPGYNESYEASFTFRKK